MTYADSGEASKHVEILVAIGVPEVDALSSFDNKWNWWVIWSNMFVVKIKVVLSLC